MRLNRTTVAVVLLLPLTATAADPPKGKPADALGYAARLQAELKAVGEITPKQFAERYALPTYLEKPSFDPTGAKFWDEFALEKAKPLPKGAKPGIWYDFRLNAEELAKFKANNFVVSERMGAATCADMFYRIYRRDLPVFISADAILSAWHRSYDSILEELETTHLTFALNELLTGMADQLPAAKAAYGTGPLSDGLRDADYFLAVARSLLAGKPTGTKFDQEKRVGDTLSHVAAEKMLSVNLFGRDRTVDFSQFKPRGHYEKSDALKQYFKAMMWCGRTDLRIAGGADATGPLSAERELASAFVLCDLLERAGKVEAWKQFDRMLQVFVGVTDSASFADLRGLMDKAKIKTPADIKDFDALTKLQDEILKGKIGLQDIRGDVYYTFPGSPVRLTLPRSFTVMGQKFALDSWATSEAVYDSIKWQDKRILRRIPSGLDVAFAAFGNNQVVPEIVERIENGTREFRDVHRGERLNHQHHLAAVRNVIDAQDPESWKRSIYTGWLRTLRALSEPTTDAKYPEAMRTKAWAMKSVNAQLASWTQLRHDSLLYVKQSYSAVPSCYYPAGFVEPIPHFWAQVEAMAANAADLLEKAELPKLSKDAQQQVLWMISDEGVRLKPEDQKDPAATLKKKQVAFLRNFAKRMATLKGIADKELAQKPLDATETKFLEDVMESAHVRFGSGSRPGYGGWYVGLHYKGYDDSVTWDALVADIHSNPPAPAVNDPGCVLHQGVGNVDLMLIAVDNGKDRMVYAGPVMSHYEFEMPGLTRMSDKEWKERLTAGQAPPRPAHTKSYLVPGTNPDAKKYGGGRE